MHKCQLTTHILPLSYSRWKVIHFLLSRTNKLDCDFLQKKEGEKEFLRSQPLPHPLAVFLANIHLFAPSHNLNRWNRRMNAESINKLEVDFDEKGQYFSHIIPSILTCRNSRHSCQWECQNSLYHTHRTAAIYANPTWYQSHAASLHWNEKRQMIRQSQSYFSGHIANSSGKQLVFVSVGAS